MSENLLLIIIPIFTLIIGVFLGIYLQKSKTKSLESSIDKYEQEIEKIRVEKDNLTIQLTKTKANFENLQQKNDEQKEEAQQLQEKFTKEFENLANKILDDKSTKFTKQNKENIENILNPLKEKIESFEKKVSESQLNSKGMHSALKQQLDNLKDLNTKISKEAENLTKALKGDSKTQGNWGELVLERILEKSGLEKGIAYEVQQSFQTENGSRVIPDVVVHLPDNKKMIIDAKVSLTAYERYINSEEDEKEIHLKEHINSIKRHIEQLSAKKYEDLYEIESPDFILMFVPIETAFAIAINTENNLYNKAFEKNIVIVTPATLLATLRIIDSMWTNQKKQENAFEIAKQAAALYEKFEGFVSDLINIGKRIDDSKTEYGKAMNKLVEGRGNLIKRVENLKKLGITAKKSLPEAIIKRANENNKS